MRRLSWGLFVGALFYEAALVRSWHLSFWQAEILGGLVSLAYTAGVTRGPLRR
jgi:lipid-A-disaccharide synthase-like uncharacterized protein